MSKKKIELLAPAGSFASLHAAIQAGADAVYFGVEQLNMRAKSADTFYIDDIKEVAKLCKSNNVKAYITLNTIIYDHDIRLLKTILKEVKKHGIDAVIAADMAVIQECREMEIPLHVSTQANISNISAVKFFAPFSDVVVLARELTLKQIEEITKEIKRKKIKGISGNLLEVEIFIHGALCMAISGKCYLSLHEQNASANRGACTQNCRRPYKVIDTETNNELLVDNEYIMSPKDLCSIDILDQVLKSGVNVLKIEGRTKGPDYVYTVTKCYREAIKAIEENTYTQEKIDGWLNELKTVYNRGFWEGNFLGRKLGEWTKNPGSEATEKKVYLGKGSNYYPKIKVGEFTIETGNIKVGDMLMIVSPAFGMIKQKMETVFVNGEENESATKGDKITFPIEHKIGAKDKLYKIVSTEESKPIITEEPSIDEGIICQW